MATEVFFPPGPPKSLFLGNAPQLKHDPLNFMVQSARLYGELLHLRFGPSHAYLVSNPAYAHYVLVERTDKFSEHTYLIRSINSAFGHDLFPPKERIQKLQRRQPLFKPDWLTAQADTITRLAGDVADRWSPGTTFDLSAEVQRLSLRMTADVLFGTSAPEIAARISASMAASRAFRGFQPPLSVPGWIPTPGNLRRQKAKAELHDLIGQLIDEHRADLDASDSLLARLIDAAATRTPIPATETYIRDEAVALFMAASEIMAQTLTWAFALLAQNPEAEAALTDELQRVLAGRLPMADDLDALPYTQMVLRETLRLYPSSWLISRQAKSEIRLANYYLPSGSLVYISPYIIQRSPRYFADPEAFIPERFADGYERRIPRYAYMPFGTGPRAYIEEQTVLTAGTLILATLAQRARLSLQPGQTLAVEPGMTLRSASGLMMQAETLHIPA